MPVWGLAAAVAFLAVAAAVAIPAALSPNVQAEAREPLPLPTMHEPEKAPLAVFLGDSYTAGAGSSNGGFVPAVAKGEGWRFQNLGRGGTGFTVREDQDPDLSRQACGADYCESYQEMIPAAAKLRPDVIVVSGGRNDSSEDPGDIEGAIRAFFASLREALPDSRIIVTSPIWDDDEAPAILGEIAAWEREAAAQVGAEYVDIGEPLTGAPELLDDDGIHPNDAGHAAIAEAITAQLSD